jgi:vacuolar-type H+-ATPase subunit I/STV1
MNKKYRNQYKKTVSSSRLSELRQELSYLLKQRYKHLKVIFNNDALVKGGIYIINRKCGKESCKCATTDYRHPSYYLYKSEQGINQTIYIKRKDVDILKELTNNYKKFRKARAELMKIEKEMAEIMNKIEEEKMIPLVREGKDEKKKKKR